MSVVMHGIDLVELGRIERMLNRHGERFLQRVYTQSERHYSASKRRRVEKLAGRFAAKESILKLVGTGWRGKINWTDIEIINNELGRPEVSLSGEVARLARQMGITQISVSITHTSDFAIASAVAIGESDD